MNKQPSNVCIIGGSGFVSGATTRLALEAGHRVTIITRGEKPIPDGVTAIKVDRKDRQALRQAIADADDRYDLVVDCIGYVEEDAIEDIAVFRDRCAHFVFVSTDFVFDPTQRVFPTPPQHPHYDRQRDYGKHKRLCELQFMDSDTGDMAWTVVRPCHIYGPGSQLGCLPMHSRDPELIARLKRGEPIKMVGGGHFLQQPIFVDDLARTILSCIGNSKANAQIYMTAGPDIIESHAYYRIIAKVLGVDVTIEEIPVATYLAEHPEHAPFLTHRIYDLTTLRDAGLHVPNIPIAEGLRRHTESLLE
jgi:nucleoside-diphosphate-sugar epimerase